MTSLEERLRQTYSMLDKAESAGDQEAVNDIKAMQDKLLTLVDQKRTTQYPGSSAISDVLGSFTQGVTFNTMDEMSGGLGAVPAVLGLGGSDEDDYFSNIQNEYKYYRDTARVRKDFPAAEFVGGVAGPGKIFKNRAKVNNAKDISTGRKIVDLAGEGMVTGALEGYGSSEAESVVGDVLNAGEGGVWGAGINMGLGAMQAFAPWIYKVAKEQFSKLSKTDADKAMEDIGNAIVESGLTPDEVISKLDDISPVASLMDLTESLRGAAVAVSKRSQTAMTEMMEFITQRQSGSSERIKGYLGEATDTTPGSYRDARGKVRQDRTDAGDKNYAFMDNAPDVEVTPELRALLDTPYVQKILGGTSGLEAGLRTTSRGGPDVFSQDTIPWRALDNLKQRIDDQINTAKSPLNPDASQRGAARIYKDLKNELLAMLDDIDPNYGKARGAHEKASAIVEAGEQGEKIATKRGSKLLDELDEVNVDEMSADEVKMFRTAGADTLGEKMAPGPTANKANRLLQEDVEPARGILATSDEAAETLQRQLEGENILHQTTARIDPSVGSKTAGVLTDVANADATGGIMSAAGSALRGDTTQAAIQLGNLFKGGKLSPGQAEQMGRILTDPNITAEQVQQLITRSGVGRETSDKILEFLRSGNMDALRGGGVLSLTPE